MKKMIKLSLMNITFNPPTFDELIKQISEGMDKPKKKVSFLAIDPKTNKSVYYGSANYPLKRIRER